MFDFLKRAFGTPTRPPNNPPSRPATPRAVNLRFLDAAKTGRLEASWTTTPSTADAMVMRDWRIVAARSRDAAENNDHARKFLQMVRDHVAGPHGFRFKADITDPPATPGANPVRDFAASDAIDAAFAEFSRKGNFDVTGRLSRREFERLWVTSMAVNGEALALFTYGDSAGPYGFALQMLDPLALDVRHNEELPNGAFIRHGIEHTAAGRPVAYHLREFETLYGGVTSYTRAQTRRVPAEHILHDFIPELLEQKRGLGWMRSVLPRLRNVKGYEDAAVINARIGAAKMGFFRDENADADDDSEIPMDAEPGVFENIGSKQFVPFDPQYPTGEFEPFMRGCLRSVAAGLNVSYNSLSNDLTAVNYSSIRQGALDERDMWKGLQEGRIESFCHPLYERWLEYALLAGKIRVGGVPLRVANFEKYRSVTFNGRRWQWVDPLKEIAAAERAVALGIKSRQSIVRETSSDDPYRILDELAEEKAEMEARGIYTVPAGSQPPVASPNNTPTAPDASDAAADNSQD